MSQTSAMICAPEVRAHVLEPLDPFLVGAGGDRDGSEMSVALREAYEKGLAEGKRQSEDELSGTARALGELFRKLREQQAAARESLRRDVLRLSLAIGRKIALCELQTNPAAVAEMVSHLLDQAEDRKVFTVRLNPHDAGRLKGTLAEMEMEKAQVTLQVSEDVPPGGCILETGFGKLDARFETRVEELAALLFSEGANAPQSTREEET